MDMLIEGSGALACLFAARFAQHGMQVTMTGSWKEGIQAISEQGVCLTEDDGQEKAYSVRVIQRDDKCEPHAQALVLVKAWQTESAARHLLQILAPNGLALTLQNGLGNYEKLSGYLGAERVCLGTTTAGATMLGPGRVKVAGRGGITLVSHPGLEPMVDGLQKAGFSVAIVNDLQALLWSKLVINAAINPLTALLRIPNGELLTRPSARALMAETAREAAAVAEAQNIQLPYSDLVEKVEDVVRNTAANRSSMLQDILRGAATEVDAINGAVVQAGEAMGLPVNVNRTLWRLVKAVEGQAGLEG
jgi:2-dehydropantoate 2-reductase